MAKENRRSAILVSSVTFGLGHILNLFNGSGMNLTEVLFQIFMAIAMGFLFVMIYLHSGSLIPCILGHGAINILSVFADKETLTPQIHLVHCAIQLLIIAVYLRVLAKTAPIEKKND